jgi:hypothetical protein
MFSPLNILSDINNPFGINILIILVFTNALFYKFIGFKEMATVAKETNNWLYDGRDKTWYTPEEFLTHYANMLSGHAEFLLRIEIKSPIVAIELSLRRIETMQTRVMAFTKRFIQYTKSKR